MLRGDHERSLRLLGRSLRLSREHNDLFGTAQVHESLSRVRLRRAEPHEAIGYAEASVDITEQTGHLAGQASALQWRGLIRCAQGSTAPAVGDVESAVSLCEDTGIASLRLDALRTLGTVLWRGRDERAHTVLAQVDSLADSLRPGPPRA